MLYAIYLEISPPRRYGGYDCGEGGYSSAYYGDYGEPCIFASLANYITIPDYGTIQIQIPYTVMQKMRPQKTYRVYLRIEDTPNSDARQILIGELPILHGGRGP